MKRCPVCQSTYADDSLRFCLQDGAALESTSATANDDFKTLLLPEDAPTLRELPPTETLPQDDATVHERQPQPTVPQRPRLTSPVTAEANATSEPKTRSTASIVALTILVTLGLLGLGGLGAWWLLGGKTAPSNDNAGNVNEARGSNNQNSTPNSNARTGNNATPTPTSQTNNTTTAEQEVRNALDGWAQSIRDGDLDEQMKHYADVLDTFYSQSNVSAEKVRATKEEAFDKYDTLDITLSDINIDVDSSGARAIATFDKTFDFKGEKDFSGSVQSRLSLAKIGGRWLITSERDLQTYYLNK